MVLTVINQGDKMTMQNTKIEAMQSKVDLINQRIDDFQGKLEKFPQKMAHELKTTLSDLEAKKSNVENKLHTAQRLTGDAVTDLETGIQMAWDDMNMAYESVKERFRNDSYQAK